MLVSDAVRGYIFSKQADGRSPQTIAIYRWALTLFANYVGDVNLDSVSKEDIQRFFIWLQNDYLPARKNGIVGPIGNRSRDLVHCNVRAFFSWAVAELDLKQRPDQSIKRPLFTSRDVIPFAQSEVIAMLKACRTVHVGKCDLKDEKRHRAAYKYKPQNSERDAALILTLLDTGLRVGELCRLRIKDVSLETASINVEPFGSGTKSRGRVVFVGKSARKTMWLYLVQRKNALPGDWLFTTDEGRQLNRNSARSILLRIGNRAGVKGVHPHKFRHTFAVQYLRNGGDVFTLQRIMGHTDLEMTRKYLALANDDSASVHRTASPADRWAL